MDEQQYDNIEDVIKMSKESKEIFLSDDGKVIYRGKIYKNKDALIKRIDEMNNAFIKIDAVVRFFTFGKRRLIPKGTKLP